MPDKQLTIATYAAGASLAAITLVYVFAPTFFIDGDAAGSASGRKRGVVGLLNTANDCFINSVLQALAGLGDLRIYLIRETHRRNLDGKEVYVNLVEDPRRKLPAWKLQGLQQGLVTQGLKDMLDALNERPLHRKTITAKGFVRCLEDAFRQRISRQQQDAQEFLQVVAERLCDEYHAGHRARRAMKAEQMQLVAEVELGRKDFDQQSGHLITKKQEVISAAQASPSDELHNIDENSSRAPPPKLRLPVATLLEEKGEEDEEEGFPFEGRYESQIECLTCRFKPKPTTSTFCTLTLNVPQVSNTTLNTCFDGMFKTEYIDDFRCEKCRLLHAVEIFESEIAKSKSETFKKATKRIVEKLIEAINKDPEKPPEDIDLPDKKLAPKQRIARHIRITKFPKIMAIHLSRSIFDIGHASEKNSAKVAFPERLPLGGILEQEKYKLLSLVTHKGGHHSGHYESFRRQNISPPFSTPNVFEKTGVYSKSVTPQMTAISTPQLDAMKPPEESFSSPSTPEISSSLISISPQASSRVSLVSSLSISHPRPSTDSLQIQNDHSKASLGPTSVPRELLNKTDLETSSLRSVARSARTTLSKGASNISQSLSRSSTPKSSSPPSSSSNSPYNNENKEKAQAYTSSVSLKTPKRRKNSSRWWRVSDEKINESKTSDVLKMQREVYLLFYELEKKDSDEI